MSPKHTFAAALWDLVDGFVKRKNTTRKAIANRLHIDDSTLTKYTSGATLPTLERLEKIAEVCQADAEQLEQLKALRNAATTVPGPEQAETSAAPEVQPPAGRSRRPGIQMLRRRWVIASTTCAALAAGLMLSPWSPDNSAPTVATKLAVCAGAATTELHIAASVDLSASLRQAAAGYGTHTSHGQCVQVVVDDEDSGTGMSTLASGWTENDGPQPDVWSPAGTVWLHLARDRATSQTKALFPAQDAPSIVTSPLTIAMPEPMAQALGWPRTTIGWSDLASWAKDAKGFWAHHGHAQWGAFKLGKTNPEYSTSGLNATIAAFFAATGTTDELVASDIDKPANRAFESAIEQTALHYGDTTLTFLANLRHADDTGGQNAATSYLSAVTVEEDAVIAYNLGYPCGALSPLPGCQKNSPPHTKLVAFYPKDGILSSDHPYIELGGMSPAKHAVADDFLAYLHSDPVQARFAQLGFRTYNGKSTAMITVADGALPDTPLALLPLPPADVLDKILNTWPTLRKHANVLILIDTSGSMNDTVAGTGQTKIELLQKAEPALLGGFTDGDRVGLWRFSAASALGGSLDYQPLVSVGPLGEQITGRARRTVLADNIIALTPHGETGLYNTLDAAVRAMRSTYDPTAVNAIVVLTDGRNETPSEPSLSLQQLLSTIAAPGQPLIRIFSIAYGDEADQAEPSCPPDDNAQDGCGKTILQEISAASGAREYDAKDPTTITDVLTSVISNF